MVVSHLELTLLRQLPKKISRYADYHKHNLSLFLPCHQTSADANLLSIRKDSGEYLNLAVSIASRRRFTIFIQPCLPMQCR
jgi:hypothetical protein